MDKQTLTVDYRWNPQSQQYEAQWELHGYIFNNVATDLGELQDDVFDSLDEHCANVAGVAFFNVDGDR